jgi:hypothetical protein
MSFDEVAKVVARHDPEFAPQALYRTHGVIVADDFESGRRVSVDPSTAASWPTSTRSPRAASSPPPWA